MLTRGCARAVNSGFRAQWSSRVASSAVRPAPVSRMSTTTKAIAVGDKLPSSTFKHFDGDGNMKEASIESLCKGKKVVFLAVPGAFTPTCSSKHVPGFIEKADEIKSKGVDTIACISVNDAFVMDAWAKNLGASNDKVMMLADGNGSFTKSIGADMDLSDKGLGKRSKRYSMLVEDMVVKSMNVEEGGALSVSSAEHMLQNVLA